MAADAHVLDVSREAVRQRQEQQQTIRLIEHLIEDDVAVLHDMREVAVGQHGALRLAGRTGRIDDGGHVIGLHTGNGLVEFGVRDSGAEIGHGVQAVLLEVEHVAQPIRRLASLLQRQRMGIVAGEGDQGLRVLEDRRRLGRGIGLVDRNAHSADGGAGEIDDAPFIAGRRIDGDHHAGPGSQSDKALGHFTHAGEHFAGGGGTPRASIIILPLGDLIIGGILRTIPQQGENRVAVLGLIRRIGNILSQHGFHHTPGYARHNRLTSYAACDPLSPCDTGAATATASASPSRIRSA